MPLAELFDGVGQLGDEHDVDAVLRATVMDRPVDERHAIDAERVGECDLHRRRHGVNPLPEPRHDQIGARVDGFVQPAIEAVRRRRLERVAEAPGAVAELEIEPAGERRDAYAVVEGRDRYVSPRGIPSLREAIAAYLKRSRRVDCTMEQVLVAPGCKMALSLTMMALIEAGD